MWQIVTVLTSVSSRLPRAYLPLLARSALLTLCALTAVLIEFRSEGTGLEPSLAVLPAMLLLCVAALASLPLPASVPASIPALAETLTAGIVVGALGPNGALFLLYLLVPIFTGGYLAGAGTGLACAILAIAVLLVSAEAANSTPDTSFIDGTTIATWVFIFIAVGLLGGWVRRTREATMIEGEPAYADAHRLLSELHGVARQLSLGLDPQTLATALADDVRALVPHGSVAVLARSGRGAFVTLVGDEPDDSAEPALEHAWVRAQAVRGERGDDGFVAAVPVLMGDRVVALVSVTTEEPVDDTALNRARAVIEQSGPRLASAMLFDDVRRLATVDERNRLAREIHDGIAQDLASVGYVLDDIRSDCDEQTGARVLGVRDQLRAMVGDLRLSIFDLRAGVDETVSLGASLSEHAQKIGSLSGLKVHVSVDESPRRLPVSVEVELMRIVQEAVTNVRRHAQAKNLWLTVTVEPPNAHISVVDDGRGLGKGRSDSFGIQGMRERAARIGALLTVEGGLSGGTVVQIGLGTAGPGETEPVRLPAVSRESLTDPRGLPLVGVTPVSTVSTVTTATTARAPQPIDQRQDQEVT